MKPNKINRFNAIVLMLIATFITSQSTNINVYIHLLTTISLIVLIPINKYWDLSAILLTIFGVLFGIIWLDNGLISSLTNYLLYILCPTTFYRLGNYLFYHIKGTNQLASFIVIMVLIYSLPLYLLTFQSIISTGEIANVTRMMDINANTNALSASLYGLSLSLGLGCMGLLYPYTYSKYIKLITLFLFAGSLLTTIHLVNRTGLAIAAIILVITFIYYSKGSSRNRIYGICIIALLLCIVSLSGIINESTIDAYLAREEQGAESSSLGGRTTLWKIALEHMISNPWGWSNISSHYAHNLWLDIARMVGFFPLFPFLIMSIITLKKSFKVFLNTNNPIGVLLIGIYVSTLLNSFVEPVIEASILYFSFVMMLWGMISSYPESQYNRNK